MRQQILVGEQQGADDNELVISYLCLRQVVGWIGTLGAGAGARA